MIPADPQRVPKKLKAAVAATTKPGAAVDWQAVLGYYGIPKPLTAQLYRIWQAAGPRPDMNVIMPQIIGTVRGSQWYQQTFPGIQEGINAGVIQDERDYRAYQNQVSQLYRQYHNRPATTAEVASFIRTGQSINQVGNQLQARAIQGTLTDPLKSLFSKDELTAFANQEAGIDSALGMRIARQADLALRVESLYQDFYGRGVTRNELNTLVGEGLTADEVAKNFATQANINAMNPAVSHLFSPEEIKQIALERAGGVTQQGQVLNAQAALAAQLNPVYHQYTGAGVSREDVARAYGAGESADLIARRFSGQAFIGANRGDIQQATGSFGEGELTDEQLKALGEQQAGIDTPMGQQLQVAYEKAQRRMQGSFRGVLARVNAALPATTVGRRRPDTAA